MQANVLPIGRWGDVHVFTIYTYPSLPLQSPVDFRWMQTIRVSYILGNRLPPQTHLKLFPLRAVIYQKTFEIY